MEIYHPASRLSGAERAAIIFSGDVIIFRQLPAMLELCQLTQRLIEQTFEELEPVRAQEYLDRETYLDKVHSLQSDYARNHEAKKLFFTALEQAGCESDDTFWDHFTIRVIPYGDSHNGGYRGAITPHRDSWGSKLHEQVNWWAPIYPLAEGRSIVFFPDYWLNPIANDTHSWSFKKYIEMRKQTPLGRKVAYLSAPQPTETVNWENSVAVVPEPGDLLCFSSSHLHASMPNNTDAARFSIEMRTVNLEDVQAGRQAPNVDCAEGELMKHWFRRVSRGDSLDQ